jgi:hypothetical protein
MYLNLPELFLSTDEQNLCTRRGSFYRARVGLGILTAVDMTPGKLSEHTAKNRDLLLLATSADDRKMWEQRSIMTAFQRGFAEDDLVAVERSESMSSHQTAFCCSSRSSRECSRADSLRHFFNGDLYRFKF